MVEDQEGGGGHRGQRGARHFSPRSCERRKGHNHTVTQNDTQSQRYTCTCVYFCPARCRLFSWHDELVNFGCRFSVILAARLCVCVRACVCVFCHRDSAFLLISSASVGACTCKCVRICACVCIKRGPRCSPIHSDIISDRKNNIFADFWKRVM